MIHSQPFLKIAQCAVGEGKFVQNGMMMVYKLPHWKPVHCAVKMGLSSSKTNAALGKDLII